MTISHVVSISTTMIIIMIRHELGLNRPVSTSCNSLRRSFPRHLRPYPLLPKPHPHLPVVQPNLTNEGLGT